MTTIKRTSYFMISPREALELENNKKINSPNLDIQYWIKIVDDFLIESLLTNDFKAQSE